MPLLFFHRNNRDLEKWIVRFVYILMALNSSHTQLFLPLPRLVDERTQMWPVAATKDAQ